LVGKVMQKTHGKADPELTLVILKKNLGIKW
jgi:Asp-tRNA(Asn)/Glu-tRNA(Gln) amidotransferase B subunit